MRIAIVSLQKKSGFTLVELSIVLVIIGLLVGGVLLGKDLIHAAELRKTGSYLQQFQTTIQAFKLKYQCLPGDCLNATDYFSGTSNGDGNGVYNPWTSESALARAHLSASELLKPVVHPVHTNAMYMPTLPDIVFGYVYTDGLYSWASPEPRGNTLEIGSRNGNCLNGIAMPATDAADIDTKMDDGRPGTGRLVGKDGAVTNSTGGGCFGAVVTCRTSSAYDLTGTDAGCRLIFYWEKR